jgi:tetratricopeptide (TPR) repeat protein
MTFWNDLAKKDPATPRYARSVANCWYAIAWNSTQVGKLDDAREGFEQFLALRKEFARQSPDDTSVMRGLAAAHGGMGTFLQSLERWDEAIAHFQESVNIFARLSEAQPKNIYFKNDLSRALDGLARARIDAGKFDEAQQDAQQALALRRVLAESDSTNKQVQDEFAQSYRVYANSLHRAGRNEPALAAAEQSLAIRQKLAAAHPDDRGIRAELAGAWASLSDIHLAMKNHDHAMRAGDEALSIYEALLSEGVAVDRDIDNLSRGYQRRGDVLRADERHADAAASYTQAIDVLSKATNAQTPRMRGTLASAHQRMGAAMEALNRPEEARRHDQAALKLVEDGALGFDAGMVNELRSRVAEPAQDR